MFLTYSVYNKIPIPYATLSNKYLDFTCTLLYVLDLYGVVGNL